jgi:ketosteroid isomerase-like protein
MLDALVDNSTFVYVALIIVCSILLFAWRRTRKLSYLLATVVGLLLVVGYAILTHVVVTDHQKIIDVVNSSALAVEKKDLATIERNMASDFRWFSKNKKTGVEWAAERIRNGDVTDVKVWDVTVDSLDKVKGTAHVSCMAKPHGRLSEAAHFRIEAVIVRESDGKWKVQTFSVFNPFVDATKPIQPPGT